MSLRLWNGRHRITVWVSTLSNLRLTHSDRVLISECPFNCAGGGRAANTTSLVAVINTSAIDFGARVSATPVNQTAYAAAFGQFIKQLQPVNQSVLLEAFASSIASSLVGPHGTSYGYTTDYTGALVQLADAAGADQSFTAAFQQASLPMTVRQHLLQSACKKRKPNISKVQ